MNKLLLIILMLALTGCSVVYDIMGVVEKEKVDRLIEQNEYLEVKLIAQPLIGNCYKASRSSDYTDYFYGTFKIVSDKDKDPYVKELKDWTDINNRPFKVWENAYYNREILKYIVLKNIKPIKCPGKP